MYILRLSINHIHIIKIISIAALLLQILLTATPV
jgi:hypothetical protein